MKKAFILVGHSHWGKSYTLNSLCGDSNHVGWITIKAHDVFVKRMSNDDIPDSLLHFVKHKTNFKDIIVIALCPNFHEKDRMTIQILAELKKKFQLYFWILMYNYNTSEEIKKDEIQKLKKYGKVAIYTQNEEAGKRSFALKKYIESYLLV